MTLPSISSDPTNRFLSSHQHHPYHICLFPIPWGEHSSKERWCAQPSPRWAIHWQGVPAAYHTLLQLGGRRREPCNSPVSASPENRKPLTSFPCNPNLNSRYIAVLFNDAVCFRSAPIGSWEIYVSLDCLRYIARWYLTFEIEIYFGCRKVVSWRVAGSPMENSTL